MKGKRLWITLRLWGIRSNVKRVEYLKKKNVFKEIGKNTTIMDRTVPLYARLIKIGNNVRLASNVKFITHDTSFRMLNAHPDLGGKIFTEKIGCIEIKDNVFVGSGTMILYDVCIGSNVIIGADSLINKDIPDNVVVAGKPAKVIDTFENFVKKRMNLSLYPQEIAPSNEDVNPQLEELLWKQFEEMRTQDYVKEENIK